MLQGRRNTTMNDLAGAGALAQQAQAAVIVTRKLVYAAEDLLIAIAEARVRVAKALEELKG